VLRFPERIDRGYTIVLPGAWGSAPLEHGIVKGLVDADVPTAVELYDWTAGPLWLVYNLRALDRNRTEAQKIAQRIVAYQDRYPGRPVNLIGYSGGGGVAVLTLEALPPDRRVTRAILLAPTLAQDYDLEPALRHTEQGIHNFHSPMDVPVLVVLTTALGTTEGRHAPSAGSFGFQIPQGRDGSQGQEYAAHLVQHQYALDMIGTGHPGGHFGWTSRAFIAKWVAPIVGPPPESEIPPGVHPQTGSAQIAVAADRLR
jgi:pimeloyl-ACP methyl ester carboxylesterase